MTRKFAAFVTTLVALAALGGWMMAAAVGQQRQPHAAAATTKATTTPSGTPTSAPTPSSTPTQKTTSVGPVPPNPTTSVAAGKKVLFLTFDDGPDPTWTPQVLATLAKYGAHATFFELGEMQEEHPGLRDQVLAAGNAIGSHSISHPQLTKLSAAQRHHQIFDGPRSTCFRPPYGATNAKVRADIKAAGMVQVLWDVDPRDWARPGTSVIAHNILTHAKSGRIVLMHDGGGNRAQTVAALEQVLPVLKAQGYTFPAMNCQQR
ncbi:polysaccharide deacetylase family protein [Kribbella sp. NPDC059898]|uniref:polysaccharide deacetylase family protein n=1 Tax=Kribbella sp. NPDC059898 TaxID=3346995 RepID=UPI00364D4649